jgi:hypothetical protein
VAEKVAVAYFEKLLKEIDWKNDEALIFGRHYITKRRRHGGNQDYLYTYSNRTKHALQWTNTLQEIKSALKR